MSTDQKKHAVEGGGAGAGDAEGAGEPAGGAEGVGQAEHPGADDGDNDVPDRLRGGRAAPPLQQRHLRLRRHRPPAINAVCLLRSKPREPPQLPIPFPCSLDGRARG